MDSRGVRAMRYSVSQNSIHLAGGVLFDLYIPCPAQCKWAERNGPCCWLSEGRTITGCCRSAGLVIGVWSRGLCPAAGCRLT